MQCAGVAICVKDICQCPPEYGAFGVSCVYLDQESNAGMSSGPVAAGPPQPGAATPPQQQPTQLQQGANHINPHWPPAAGGSPSSSEPAKPPSLLMTNAQPTQESNSLFLPPPPPAVLYAYPGSSCGSRNLCIGGSVCRNGLCVCNQGFVQSGFTCVQQRDYNQQQQISQHFGNSRELQNSLVPPPVRLPYQRTSNIFGEMDNSISLMMNPSVAHPAQYVERVNQGSSFPSLSCPPDQVLMGANCVPRETIVKYPIGILCADGIECPGVAVCINSVCTCPSGYVWTNSGCSSAPVTVAVTRHKANSGRNFLINVFL